MDNDQGDLFRGRSIQERFEKFHGENPHVYRLVCRFVDELIAAGCLRAGIKLVWERIRWEMIISTRRDDDFKLNNIFHAHYARLWLDDHPEHPEFFELRKLRTP